jgi:hypothetical protein
MTLHVVHRTRPLRTPFVRLAVALGVFGAVLASAELAAQERPTLQVQVDDACADADARDRLGQALLERLPDVAFGGGDSAWTLAWLPADGACVVRLSRGGTEHSLPLPANAPDADLVQAASRVAWWISSEAEPVPVEEPSEGSGAAEGSAAVVEPTPVAEEGSSAPVEEPVLPRVPFVVGLTPGIAWPAINEPVEASLSFHILGNAEARINGAALAFAWNDHAMGGRGAQLSFFANLSRGPFRGFQYSSLLNLASAPFSGIQFSSVNLTTRNADLTGVQFGAFNYTSGPLRGVQFGAWNHARGPVRGVQAGAVNVARAADIQLGFVNVADSARISLGFLSVVRDQPVHVHAMATERSWINVGLRHGSRLIQNIFEYEIDPSHTDRMSLGYGIGARVGNRLYGELDFVSRIQFTTKDSPLGAFRGQISQFRASVGYRFLPRLAVFGGVSYNLLVARRDRIQGEPAWTGLIYEYDNSETNPLLVVGWVGTHLGLRF